MLLKLLTKCNGSYYHLFSPIIWHPSCTFRQNHRVQLHAFHLWVGYGSDLGFQVDAASTVCAACTKNCMPIAAICLLQKLSIYIPAFSNAHMQLGMQYSLFLCKNRLCLPRAFDLNIMQSFKHLGLTFYFQTTATLISDVSVYSSRKKYIARIIALVVGLL